jgi:hypothetical protein
MSMGKVTFQIMCFFCILVVMEYVIGLSQEIGFLKTLLYACKDDKDMDST